MKDKLLIIGASGHGKVVADIALKMNKWNNIVFLDDDEDIITSLGLKVIGKSADAIHKIDEYDMFVGIGNNQTRQKIQNELELIGANLPILIHPNSVIGEQVNISSGTVIMAGVVINSCTSIGRGCIINTAATIDHDNTIEDFVHISPGSHLAGKVTVGNGSWLGIGCNISNNISIAEKSIVGAGSVVINDTSPYSTVVGVPAHVIKIRK